MPCTPPAPLSPGRPSRSYSMTGGRSPTRWLGWCPATWPACSTVRPRCASILPHVVDALHAPGTAVAGSTVAQLLDDGREVAHALARLVSGGLAGPFDGP